MSGGQATAAGGEGDAGAASDGGDGEGADPPQPPGAARSRWLALLVLCVPTVLLNVEGTVLNVAIPQLVEGLGASGPQLLWILDAYSLFFACLVLTAGALADRFGRRRVLWLGVAAFGASCAWAALSSSPPLLIAARCTMGLGAALLYPTSLALIVHLFDEPAERARAISIWVAGGTVGIILGPLAGGLLIDRFGWGAAFGLSVPLCVVVLVALPLLVPDGGARHRSPIDLPGLLTSAPGLALLLYGVIAGPEAGWSAPEVLVPLLSGCALFAGFVWWELRCAHPMVDLALFRVREFVAASVTIATVFFALVGWTLLLSQYLQFVLGLDAFTTGLCLAPAALGQLVSAATARRLMRAAGRRTTILIGIALLAGSTAAFAWPPLVATVPLVVLNRFVEGLGIGLAFIPATDSVMRCVSPERSSVGSAVNDTTRMTAAMLGLGVLGTITAVVYGARIGSLPFVPADLREHASSSVGSAFGVAAQLPHAAAAQLLDAARRAFVVALHVTTYVSVAIMGAAGLVAWRGIPRHEPVSAPASARVLEADPA
jgi:EmrB/QacA subfamily drug resistance transporter